MTDLFTNPLHIVAVGADLFADALTAQHVPVTRIDWQPAPDESDAALSILLNNPHIEQANQQAVQRMMAARPRLIDVLPAAQVIQGMQKHLLLHAGPPISWERMSGPLRGAIIGAMLYEGLAPDQVAAERVVVSGAIAFAPCRANQGLPFGVWLVIRMEVTYATSQTPVSAQPGRRTAAGCITRRGVAG